MRSSFVYSICSVVQMGLLSTYHRDIQSAGHAGEDVLPRSGVRGEEVCDGFGGDNGGEQWRNG
jgi:hypothetical protein